MKAYKIKRIETFSLKIIYFVDFQITSHVCTQGYLSLHFTGPQAWKCAKRQNRKSGDLSPMAPSLYGCCEIFRTFCCYITNLNVGEWGRL